MNASDPSMRLTTGFRITYDCPAPVPMLLMLSVHPSRRLDLETADWLQTDPQQGTVDVLLDFKH